MQHLRDYHDAAIVLWLLLDAKQPALGTVEWLSVLTREHVGLDLALFI